ncbi:cellobiose phosphorylase [Paenibacillus crassostreae]|uniref:Cellobiose phosphorylase n=1 Tax=Paenibacillus crassostreae TaxID=1763538 RepID=A0A167BV84_9BACL|nr:cellobiose phosphorylase [Paenibacillus crassostreae]AOZ92531.1 cellobiose phosphorylase [Paenibacillus crassostreae]OAB72479.1 cellobiose phosphorylase [Paenibacillus crassostreae]
MPKYYYEKNSFVIEEFDQAKPFSSFLPGIAGLKGIPMWTFYVNRGQGVCSFGIRDKNSAIMEFSPASITYKSVAANGFRTFIKIAGKEDIYEPFQSARPDTQASRTMRISPNGLMIEEIHAGHGLKTTVHYFHLPNDDYAALVRQVEIVNIGNKPLQIELLDGMPEILPYGVQNGGFKEIGNLLRSWMEVYNLENRIPFYHVRSSTEDEARVSEVTSGHFYLSFTDDGKRLAPIVDFEVVFGGNTSLMYPDNFATSTLAELAQQPQYPVNKVPCGFSGVAKQLAPGESLSLNTIIGHVNDIERINAKADIICTAEYISRKKVEAGSIVEELTADIATHTSSEIFDAYAGQSYMDNFLRGGYPFIFDNEGEGFVVHLYSRKHGDLERDYNFFSLAPEYYSQGNGNFRDMNQNRRNDVFFNPKVGYFNIKMFFSLMQADGYNPLSVQGCSFKVTVENKLKLKEWIVDAVEDHHDELVALCSDKFTPGQIINYVADQSVQLKVSEERLLSGVLALSQQNFEAGFGEGFWSDHWTYNMDLVDSYLDIFPDKKEELLFGDDTYTFYDSAAQIQPRTEKYVVIHNQVRQYDALVEDEEKLKQLGRSMGDTNWLQTDGGKGDVYSTNLFVKMVSLALNKFTCLDPHGMGVEMEANKPGWNDAMNGLPGLIGSGMSETFELKRMITFLLDSMKVLEERVVRIPEEIVDLLEVVHQAVRDYREGNLDSYTYWDRVASAREAYRDRIRFGITGVEREISVRTIEEDFSIFLVKIDEGITKAVELGNGITPTYLRYEATEFEEIIGVDGKPLIGHHGLPKAKVKSFQVHVLPYFLEGPTRWMKTLKDPQQVKEIYHRIKKTGMYDQTTQMYQTSVSLDAESHEIGRMRAFTPGWLERESNFLHMSYKYLLELLKSGLYEQYFGELRTSLVPFLDPAVYGRSTLENSSFIATGGNPDPEVHGRGFVARLSGSTAEFLSMWRRMMVGNHLFIMSEGQLTLTLAPALPSWLFDDTGKVSFTLLGSTLVTYHNPRRADTFGSHAAKISKMKLLKGEGTIVECGGAIVQGADALAIRDGEVEAIEVFME